MVDQHTLDLFSWAIMVKCCESQTLDFKSFNLLFYQNPSIPKIDLHKKLLLINKLLKIFNKTKLPIYNHCLELPITKY